MQYIDSYPSFDTVNYILSHFSYLRNIFHGFSRYFTAFYIKNLYKNGELTYSHDEGVDGAVRLEFNETVSGMVYMTARNLSDNPCVQIFDASGSHKGTPYAQSSGVAVVDAGNGYKTYCFNFGTAQVKSIRLFTGYDKSAPFSNVSIKDFTVVK